MTDHQRSIDSKTTPTILSRLLFWIILLWPVIVGADNNMTFLDKKIIKNLRFSVYEVVVPKVEIPNIQYARDLPFHKLSYKEREEKYFSIGTAFFINDKELMTAAHVLNLKHFSLLTDFHIRDSDGRVYKIGHIKQFSSIRDMVVFELEQYPENILTLDVSKDVEIGDTVFSVGNAQGEGLSFRAGQVASFTTEPEHGKWKDIRFTSPASPGNSGGPLLNVDGEVVGLIIQKNASENYNVAVPMTKVDNLTNTADFYIRNISMNLNGSQNTYSMDWSEHFALPSDIDTLSRKAQTSLNALYENLSSKVSQKYETEYFPKGKRFRAYLRNQVNVRQFGVLQSDADFNMWRLSSYAKQTIPVSADQKITLSKSDLSTLQVKIEKPHDLALEDFLASPKLVMDHLLKAVPLTRDFDVEKVRIVSLGEPEKTERWEDQLGRPWISSLWYRPYNNSFVYSHCLAYPKGAMCNVDLKKARHLRTGYLSLMKKNLNEVAVGYEGGLDDWLEYVSLRQHYLPRTFKTSTIRLQDGALYIALNDFTLQVNHHAFTKKTNLHFHFGYSNKNLLEEELLLFELIPKKGVDAHYRIQKYFSPSMFSSDTYLSQWDDITARTGNFSGTVVNDNKHQIIRNVVSGGREEIASVDGDTFLRETVIGCFYTLSEENPMAKCDKFTKSIHFNEQRNNRTQTS
ncbi:MAG: serine protease [Nitrospirales bacterium]|nr:MAG: serine protease [Nitrospirales bacterium]